MKLYFLGTGTSQGIPVIGSTHPVCLSDDPRDKRQRVSIWLQWEGHSYVIDCGPDFRAQMLRSGCSHIDGILFTHEHADHTAGLDDIRPFFFNQGDIPVYMTEWVENSLRRRFDYIFETENKYPGAPSVQMNRISAYQPFNLGSKVCMPLTALHGQLPVLGFRIDNMAYMTDVKTLPNETMEQLKGLDVLVLNALRLREHPTHLNLDEALTLIALLKPKRTYLTHISHLLGFHAEVEKNLPEGVFLAYDNLEINIP